IEELIYHDVHYYFVDNQYYFNRTAAYGYEDEAERTAYFSKAIVECLPYLAEKGGFCPNLIHCNDWHTALVPVFQRRRPEQNKIKSLLTIHNLKYQGVFPYSVLTDVLGFDPRDDVFSRLDFGDCINYLKAGIYECDYLTTVSPTYAQEIQNPYYGEGLDYLFREKQGKLKGIINGVDDHSYNPDTDSALFVKYKTSLSKKEKNKTALQEQLGLPVKKEVPLIISVSRLVEQKGFDLIFAVLEELLQNDLQLVILGTGEQKYEEVCKYFAFQYPNKFKLCVTFDDVLARRLYAAGDMLLMPSRFEPCGISQMLAILYSTIPIVRETGGLRDTVIPYNQYTGEGTGFCFSHFNAHEMLFTIQKALDLYYNHKEAWTKIIENGRKVDFSWKASAKQYKEIYNQLC
ncbi:MAG: glycogen synthase, partial [Anaerovorax sp.]